MEPFVHIVCDYAPGDMAWAEVIAAIRSDVSPNAAYHMTSVGAFETISTGFVTAQLALADESMRPKQMIIFANCAPRKDALMARKDNEGEGLLYGKLNNGVQLLVVNSGYSLSFLRSDLVELFSVSVDDRGSQFRSRDFYPPLLRQLISGDLAFKNQPLKPLEVIPQFPEGVIGYIDSFGNIKTTFRDGAPGMDRYRPGQRVRVIIGGIIRTATVASGSFNVMEGDLAFAPGSSGHSRRFWEFFQRGGSAWTEFSRPPAGSQITVEH